MAGPVLVDVCSQLHLESSAFHSEEGEHELGTCLSDPSQVEGPVLVILKGSPGTPVTLVMGAESAIFPFTWWEGKGILFLKEKYINRSTFIFLTSVKKTLSDIALPSELLLQSPLLLL